MVQCHEVGYAAFYTSRHIVYVTLSRRRCFYVETRLRIATPRGARWHLLGDASQTVMTLYHAAPRTEGMSCGG